VRARLKVGDVFTIPVDVDHVGVGQIAASWGGSRGHFYFSVFDAEYETSHGTDYDEVTSAPLALLALSVDALLHHGHWRVVGHAEVDVDAFPWPAYKEGVSPPGTFDVVDFSGKRRRRATPSEADRLPFRTIVAPIRIERALRALHGREPWLDEYDSLLPPASDATSRALFS
jgi:hypothetical protein